MMLRVKDRWASYRCGLAALVAGTVLRLVFLRFHPRFAGDALTYGDLAHNLLYHHIFGFTEGRIRPTLIRLPGYPGFLALCFALFGDKNYLAVLWVQIVVDLGSCALLGVLGARLLGRRVGLATLWLAALCPFTANYAVAALTETWSLFCVVLAMFALERFARGGGRGTRWALVMGAALAYAVLLRPDQGLLAAAFVPAMAWVGLKWKRPQGLKPLATPGLMAGLKPGPIQDELRHASQASPGGRGLGSGDTRWLRGVAAGLRGAALASLVVALPLLAWGVRNKITMHVFQPLAPRYANDPGEPVLFGFQRWYRSWAIDFKSTVDVYWTYDGDTLRLADLPARAFDSAAQRAKTQAVYADYNVNTTSTPALDVAFGSIADERIKAHPLRYCLLLPVARDLNMWLRPRTELMKMPVDWWNFVAQPLRSVGAAAYALLDVAYLVLAGVGLWVWGRRCWGGEGAIAGAMIAFVVLRSALLLTLDNSEPRYTLECFPVVILLAGIALGNLGSKRQLDRAGL